MGAITKGLTLGGFTSAQPDIAGFFCHKRNGFEVCSLMRAIAKRLLLTETAAAPKIGFAFFYSHTERAVFC